MSVKLSGKAEVSEERDTLPQRRWFAISRNSNEGWESCGQLVWSIRGRFSVGTIGTMSDTSVEAIYGYHYAIGLRSIHHRNAC